MYCLVQLQSFQYSSNVGMAKIQRYLLNVFISLLNITAYISFKIALSNIDRHILTIKNVSIFLIRNPIPRTLTNKLKYAESAQSLPHKIRPRTPHHTLSYYFVRNKYINWTKWIKIYILRCKFIYTTLRKYPKSINISITRHLCVFIYERLLFIIVLHA